MKLLARCWVEDSNRMGLLERRLLMGTSFAFASVAAQIEELVSQIVAVADGNTIMVLDVDPR